MWECGCGHGEVSAVAIPDQYKPVRLESSPLLGSPQALNTQPLGDPHPEGTLLLAPAGLGMDWENQSVVLSEGLGVCPEHVRGVSEVCPGCVRGVPGDVSGVCPG